MNAVRHAYQLDEERAVGQPDGAGHDVADTERSAARHSVPHLAAIAHADMDILLRLKASPPPRDSTPRGQAKRALREDADALLRRLLERLAEQAAADTTK